MSTMSEKCPCGQPLHYATSDTERIMRKIVATHGETTTVVQQSTGRRWLVPRHYIALHGLQEQQLPVLAEVYGWPELLHDKNNAH